MTARRIAVGLLVVVAGALAVPVIAAAADADTADCAAVAALVKNGHLVAAETRLKTLEAARQSCPGVRNTIRDQRARAYRRVLEAEDLLAATPADRNGAIQKLATASSLDADSDALKAELDKAIAVDGTERSDDPYQLARALKRAGFTAKAQEAAREALKAHPETEIPRPLREHDPEGLKGWGDTVKDWTDALKNLVVFGGLLVAAAMVIGFIWRKVWSLRFVKQELVIKELVAKYGGPETETGGDRAAGTRVMATILNELQVARESGRSLNQLTGGADLPKLGDLPDEAKALTPLFEWLRRPRRNTLRSELIVAGAESCELRLELVGPRGGVIASNSFRGEGSKAGECAVTAGIDGGAWLLFVLLAQRHRWRPNRATQLGAHRWRSYSLYRQAMQCAGSQREKKQTLLHRALDVDHRNVGALCELGRSQASVNETGQAEAHYDEGLDHLRLARAGVSGHKSLRWRIATVGFPKAQCHPLWFQTTYSLSVAELNLAFLFLDGTSSDELIPGLADGEELVEELVRSLAATHHVVTGVLRRYGLSRRARRGLVELIDTDGTSPVSVYAAVRAYELRREGKRHAPMAFYRLPSQGALVCPREITDDTKFWKWFRQSEATNPATILGALTGTTGKDSGRALYNRAVAYVQTEQWLCAIADLESSFAHATGDQLRARVHEANNDPSLKPLRDQCPALFEGMMANHPLPEVVAAPPPTTPSDGVNNWTAVVWTDQE